MLRLSHEFIKILDERDGQTLEYMLHVTYEKRKYWLNEKCIRSGMQPGVNAVKDVE